MKKIFQLCAVLAVMFAVTGCYNDFDAPKPAKVYTDEDFAGMKHISIADVKQMFLDEHKSLGGTGSNSSWGDTKYVQIGQSPDGLDYYIKGKVQSSDEEGNVYKSLYLVDDSGAIEVKLTTGLYFTYPMGRFDKATGTIPSNWVYVKVSGLYIGNYRMMLSLGEGPTDSYNKVGEHKFYANRTSKTRRRSASACSSARRRSWSWARRSSRSPRPTATISSARTGSSISGVW